MLYTGGKRFWCAFSMARGQRGLKPTSEILHNPVFEEAGRRRKSRDLLFFERTRRRLTIGLFDSAVRVQAFFVSLIDRDC